MSEIRPLLLTLTYGSCLLSAPPTMPIINGYLSEAVTVIPVQLSIIGNIRLNHQSSCYPLFCIPTPGP